MLVHSSFSANWHSSGQVPNDTLQNVPIGRLPTAMMKDFQRALLWHMDQHDTKVAELARATGVTRDVINKLRLRDSASTDVENAILIAAYYGKSVTQFINCEEPDDLTRLTTLFEMLPPEERRLLEAQIRGLLAPRPS